MSVCVGWKGIVATALAALGRMARRRWPPGVSEWVLLDGRDVCHVLGQHLVMRRAIAKVVIQAIERRWSHAERKERKGNGIASSGTNRPRAANENQNSIYNVIPLPTDFGNIGSQRGGVNAFR